MRATLAIGLLVAVIAAGCGVTSSISEPVAVAPSLEPGEQPIDVVGLAGSNGDAPLTLRIYDRSLALDDARSATKQELADISGDLNANAIGLYQSVAGEVLVAWQGSACPGTGDLFVGAGVTEILIVPTAGGDCGAGPSTRGVNLTFRPSVDLERVSASFARPAGG